MNINLIYENQPPQGHPDLQFRHPIKNFTVVESVWGKFILCRNSQYHPEVMIKTGRTIHPAELETLANIISTLPEGCVIVDGGANVGAFCVPIAIAAEKRKGTVYAFEVQKKLYQALCGTVVLNDFDNLEVYNYGLGDREKTLKIPRVNYGVHQDYGVVSLADQSRINQQEHEEVNVVSIDSLELEGLDLFKIDVEGMEMEVLQGSISTVKKYRPYFWIEFWHTNINEIKSYFNDVGNYTLYKVTGADILCVPNERTSNSDLIINCPLF